MTRTATGEGVSRIHNLIKTYLFYGALFALTIGFANIANAATFTVSNLDDAGAGSLRQAIISANSTGGADTINFSIAGTISLLTPLDPITEQVTIDGYTAPGAAVNTNGAGAGFNGTLTVELNGSGAGVSSNGLQISAPNCLVRGLVINRFGSAGIRVNAAGSGTNIYGNFIGTNTAGNTALGNVNRGVLIVGASNVAVGSTGNDTRNVISGNSGTGISITGGGSATIRKNLIGTNSTGTADLGNSQEGVRIADSSGSVIGGNTAASRNVISGNNSSGISILQSSSTTSASGNSVVGNFIGVDIGGNIALPNSGSGVLIGASGNTVGGNTSGARNVISSNNANGVSIGTNFATGNTVSGNFIGIGDNGAATLPNRDSGIQISNLAAGNTIGSTTVTTGNCDAGCNVIAHNGDVNSTSARAGVYIDATGGAGNAIRGNSIYMNTGIGIDLGAVGTTANDASDPDTGANNLQNFPAITSAQNNGTIAGTLNSLPNTTFAVDFFRNASTDTMAASEGRTFIGATNVVTDGSGNATISFNTGATLTVGEYVTATATNTTTSDTSEFSAAQIVTAAPGGGAQGFEGDVVDRPDGNGSVSSTDIAQIRRFSVGLDMPYMSNEFQRADCAPFADRGNGVVAASDVAQARRYSVGLDGAPQPAAGPTAPPQNTIIGMMGVAGALKSESRAAIAPREVRIVNNTAKQGNTVTVTLEADTMGDESVYNFSVNFDSTRLTNPVVMLGSASSSATLTQNVRPPGQDGDANRQDIGINIDFGNTPIQQGNNLQLLTIQFDVPTNAPTGQTPVTFDGTPAPIEVSNTAAQALPTTFTNGTVTVTAQRVVRVVDTNTSRGQTVTVMIQADTAGDESVYNFSVNFDSTRLTNPVVMLGSASSSATLTQNVRPPGQDGDANRQDIGINIDFGNTPIQQGNNLQLLTIQFDVPTNAPTGQTPVTFDGTPAPIEVSNTAAQAVPTTFQDGNVNIAGPTAAPATVKGKVITNRGRGVSRAIVQLTKGDGRIVQAMTNQFGYFRFNEVEVGEAYTISVRHKRYRSQSQFVQVNGDVEDLTIVVR